LLAFQGAGTPKYSYERTFGTFYLNQNNARYGDAGKMYCGPTSGAMACSWLAGHGYPKLLPTGDSQVDSLRHLVELLASDDFMGTDPEEGTPPARMIAGFSAYVEKAGYGLADMQFSGWRVLPPGTARVKVSPIPDLDTIPPALANPHAIVLVNVGYYVQGSKPGELRRLGGHWVTAVGYGTTGNGEVDPSVLLIHNPAHGRPKNLAPRTDLPARLEPDVTKLSPISGFLYTKKGKPICSAKGMYAIDGRALHKTRNSDIAVVDGVLAIALAPPE